MLEIQDIQTQLLYAQISRDKIPRLKLDAPVWAAEICSDELTRMLLRYHDNLQTSSDSFIFSHWHQVLLHILIINQDGDNFTGTIQNVVVNKTDSTINNIQFTLTFSTPTATLDDVFAGQETVVLRNEFNIPCMDQKGQFSTFVVKTADGVHHLRNGNLPPRYKAVFSRQRSDRITDLWKAYVECIILKYIPPPQLSQLSVDSSLLLSITLHITTQKSFIVYMKRSDTISATLEFNRNEKNDLEGWEKIVNLESIPEDGKKIITYNVTLSAGHYTFMTLDGRVGLHAQL